MLLRKPLSPWISFSLYAGVVAMIPLVGQLRHRPVSPPRALTELTARLSECTPPLHIVPQFQDRPNCPIWLSTQPQNREQLWGLLRHPERAKIGQWQGIVFCERLGEKRELGCIDEIWGEYGMHIGRFVFFGDPDLLQRIREAILDGEAAGKDFEILSE